MLEVNVNQFVKVKLTEKGKEHLINFWKKYSPDYTIHLDEEGYYRTQLHSLMLEFGGTMFWAFEPPFEKCKITIIEFK